MVYFIVMVFCMFLMHTKYLMKPELKDWRKALDYNYKNVKSLEKVDMQYVMVYCWWLLSNITCETRVHELGTSLTFGIFKGGGVMIHVKESFTNYVQ